MVTVEENVSMCTLLSSGLEYQYLWKLYPTYALFILSKDTSFKKNVFSPSLLSHYNLVLK